LDSRAYVFIFPIERSADIPADFRPAIKDLQFETGVFLPQDDANWFTRAPEYPARVLLLNRERLHIIPHPTSRESSLELALHELNQLEVGNILLLGWIALHASATNICLPYNTRASKPLDHFVERVAERWLPEPNGSSADTPAVFGAERDIKFNYLLRYSLVSGELPEAVFFSPPLPFREKTLVFKRLSVRPGHLLATTSRGRLLWATDEHKRRYERYAAIARSARLSLLQHSELRTVIDHHELVLAFAGNRTWQIPIYAHSSAAGQFCQWLNECASASAMRAPGELTSVRPQPVGGKKPHPSTCQPHNNAGSQI
jgi:hypothetical protein